MESRLFRRRATTTYNDSHSDATNNYGRR
eukprot:SAG11_NODE_40987_length_199_cov_15.250000_1_plen_28_part_10